MNATEIVSQEQASCDPLVDKLDAAGFFTPPTPKITTEQALALAPAPSWADRPTYSRRVDDEDGGYWITEDATISETDVARVGVERQTAVTGAGIIAHQAEFVRVAHADEEFFLETRHVSRIFAEIRSAATSVGVTL